MSGVLVDLRGKEGEFPELLNPDSYRLLSRLVSTCMPSDKTGCWSDRPAVSGPTRPFLTRMSSPTSARASICSIVSIRQAGRLWPGLERVRPERFLCGSRCDVAENHQAWQHGFDENSLSTKGGIVKKTDAVGLAVGMIKKDLHKGKERDAFNEKRDEAKGMRFNPT